MKKIFLLVFLLVSLIGYSQNGISYQALILNPSGEELPGVNNSNAPLSNKLICLKFSILDSDAAIEYLETHTVTTDAHGIVNLIIGTGDQIGGYASSFADVVWNNTPKNLKVDLDVRANCTYFVEISNQPFTYVPFAYYAANAHVDEATTLSTGIIQLAGDLGGIGTTANAPIISNNAITSAKIVNGAVTPIKIASGANNTVLVTDATGNVAWVDRSSFGAIADMTTIEGAGTTANPFKVKDLGIVTNKIADLAVTNAKLAADAVTTDKILDGEVQTADIKNLNVTTPKLADAAVTTTKIASGGNNKVLVTDNSGAVAWIDKDAFGVMADQVSIEGAGTTASPFKVKDLGIVTNKIADLAVTNAKLAADAVTTDKILDGEVQTADIKNLNVTTPKLADAAVTTSKIASGANNTVLVTDATGNVAWLDSASFGAVADMTTIEGAGTTANPFKVKDLGIVTNKLANASVTPNKIAPGVNNTVLVTDFMGNVAWIDSGSFGAVADMTTIEGSGTTASPFKVKDVGIITQKIANNAVTSPKIANAAVTTSKIASGGNNKVLVTDNTGVVAWIDGNAFGAVADMTTIEGAGTTASPFKVKDLGIITSKLADGAVTTFKIADLNVTTAKLADLSVTNAKLADLNVTTNKLANAAVTTTKIASGGNNKVLVTDNTGVVAWLDATAFGAIADMTSIEGAGTSASPFKVKDLGIITSKLADNAVTTNKIADLNITTNKVANNAITTSKLADLNVTTEKINNAAVTTSKIASGGNNKVLVTDNFGVVAWLDATAFGAVADMTTIEGAGTTASPFKVKDLGIVTNKLANLAVTNAKLAADAVTTDKILDGEVQTADIKNLNVTTEKLNDAAVTTSKIASGGTNKVLVTDGTGTVAWINATAFGAVADMTTIEGAGTIASPFKVKDLGIVTNKLADLAVTNAKLAANSVTTDKIVDGEVQTADIKNLNVTTEKLNDAAVTTTKIASGSNNTVLVTDATGNVAWIDRASFGAVADMTTIEGAGTTASPFKVKDLSIITNKLADGAVTTSKIASGGINKVLVTDSSGNVAWIDGSAFGAIADMTTIEGAGTTASPFKVKNLGIITEKLANDAVTSPKILDGTIIVDDLANDAVETAKIKNLNVTTNKLADDAVTTGKILNGTILNVDIADDTITTDKIAGQIAVSEGGTGSNMTNTIGYVKQNTLGSNFTTVTSIPVADVAGAVRKVNGVSPNTNGEVTINWGTVYSGTLANIATVVPNPANGDTYVIAGDTSTNNGRTFIYDGTNWLEVTPNQAALDARYLRLTGDTMQGDIIIPSSNRISISDLPTNPSDATNKAYVDAQIASGAPDATSTVNGKIRLAGDLAGTGSTAAAPVITNNAITTSKLADNAVTTDKILDGEVQTADIKNLNVTTEKLNDAAVTTTKIASGGNNKVLVTDASGNVAWIDATAFGAVADITTIEGLGTTASPFKVKDLGIVTNKLADLAVTNAKLAADAVTTDKILDGEVQTADIKDLNVTTAKINDAAVTTTKIASGGTNKVLVTDGTGTVAWINANAFGAVADQETIEGAGTLASPFKVKDLGIITDKLANLAVTNAKLAENAVTTDKILDAEVQTADIKNLNVTTEKINDAAVTTTKIADANVTTTKLANASVTTTKIASGGNSKVLVTDNTGVVTWIDATDFGAVADMTTIEGAGTTTSPFKVKDLGIITAKLANDAVTSPKILDGTIIVDDLANDAVETSKIKNLNVTTNKLANDAVTSGKILNETILNEDIADNTITTSKIAGQIAVSDGGTGSDMSSTLGYVKQANSGANFTTVTSIPVGDVDGAVIKVNGNLPDSNGNVTVALGMVSTGILANIPLITAPGLVNGDIYVVSGDSNPLNNGLTFIFNDNPAQWLEVTPNQAALDARYLRLAGGTMQGDIVIPATKKITITDTPNTATDAVNKAYVDAQIASGAPDATTSLKGKIQLGGDLAGTGTTAETPIITDNAITTNKINPDAVTTDKIQNGTIISADLADAIITNAKLAETISVPNGGTGATTLTGYVKGNGTSAMSAVATIPVADIVGAQTTANLASDITANTGSTTLYPSVAAVEAFVANSATPDATTALKGKIKLAGDLSGTADLPTVPGLALKAPLDSPLLTGVPVSPTAAQGTNTTQIATTEFVTTAVAAATIADATSTIKGKLQLAGDLAGTGSSAASPVISNNAITTSKILDDAVTNAKIGEIISVENGGTGSNMTTTAGYVKQATTGANLSTVSTIPVADVTGAVRSVNGVVPSTNGNVAVIIGRVFTGATVDPNLATSIISASPPKQSSDIYIVADGSNPNNGRTFIYDGTNWLEVATDLSTTDARYVNVAGDTMEGNLTVPTGTKIIITDAPTGSTDAVNKAYVDGLVSSSATPDATASIKGKIKLAGDLGGTADLPTVPGLALKAPLESPALTGVPTAPTPTAGTNTTQIATTAFVTTAVTAASGTPFYTAGTTNDVLSNKTVNIYTNKNIGIGTSAPQNNIDVVGGVSIRSTAGASGTGFGMEINTSSNAPRIDWVANGAYIGQFSSDNNDFFLRNSKDNTGNIRFFTKTATFGQERLTILNNGNVGIGTSTPVTNLQINNPLAATASVNANAQVLRLSRPDTNSIKWNNIAQFNLGSYSTAIAAASRLDLALTNGLDASTLTNVMTWQANGNVGINNTTPSAPLVVQGVSGTGVLKLIAPSVASGDNWWLGFGHGTSSTDANDRARIGAEIIGGGSGRLFFTTGSTGTQTRAMFIDEFQRVGIGTNTPLNKLVVTGTNNSVSALGTNQTNATFRVDGNSNHALDMGTFTNSPWGSYIQSHNKASTASLPLSLNPVGGNVGIGTSNPISKLEVNGSATNTAALNNGAANAIAFSLSNLAYTSLSAQLFNLTGMKDGGTYTLAVQGTTSGTSSFMGANPSGTPFVFKSINNGTTIAGKDTLYTFVVMGTTVYVYMATGF